MSAENGGLAIDGAGLVRTVDGVQLPAAGQWRFAAGTSAVWCSVRHLQIARVRGSFRSFSGIVTVGATAADCAVTVTIDAASIETGSEFRDRALRSPEFLDCERFPAISYRSTCVAVDGTDWSVGGELTANGITGPVSLAATFRGVAVDHLGNVKAIFSASARLSRREWNMRYDNRMPGGLPVVGPSVDLEIWIDATRASEP